MKVLHTIRDTPPNPQGLCALSINSDNCYLAFPGSSTIGEVQIFDAINLVRISYFVQICLNFILFIYTIIRRFIRDAVLIVIFVGSIQKL